MRCMDFGLVPTPLQELPRLSALLGEGRRLFIKRDDLLGVGLGGNKIRRFAYYLGEALDTGCDIVVAGGAGRGRTRPSRRPLAQRKPVCLCISSCRKVSGLSCGSWQNSCKQSCISRRAAMRHL